MDVQISDLGKGWMLLTSSCTKNSVGSRVGGVGIMMSPFAYKTLERVEKVNARIIMAKFSGNPATTIISCYSPTNCSPDVDAENFYNTLTDVVKQVPHHNFTIIGGDMNAQVSSADCKGHTYGNRTNRNGRHLLDMGHGYGM